MAKQKEAKDTVMDNKDFTKLAKDHPNERGIQEVILVLLQAQAEKTWKIAQQEERERIFEWGNEPCDGDETHWGTIYSPLKEKRKCPECWQALKGKKEE